MGGGEGAQEDAEEDAQGGVGGYKDIKKRRFLGGVLCHLSTATFFVERKRSL